MGSRNSSTLNFISHHFPNLECRTVREPVELFRNYRDEMYNPLMEMQEDVNNNAFATQLHILEESVLQYRSSCSRPDTPVMVSNRSVCSPFAFIDCFFKRGVFSWFSKDFMLGLWSEKSKKVPKPDVFIFIDAPPARCLRQLREDKNHCYVEHKIWTEEAVTVLHDSHHKMFALMEIPTKIITVIDDMMPGDV